MVSGKERDAATNNVSEPFVKDQISKLFQK